MTSPTPWRVVYSTCPGHYEKSVENIVDADGEIVVETDCGFYAPKWEDAELIVKAVNFWSALKREHEKYPHGRGVDM